MCTTSSLGRRHLVNAYEVKTGIGVIAGKTVQSMPERLACTTKNERYINTLTYLLTYLFNILAGSDPVGISHKCLTRGQSNLTKSVSRGPIPRLGVTPGGQKLYH